ncbi:MAG: transcriptional regulator [Paenibacillus sp.]|jgi:CRP/FNR family transcriptional regulator|nr:transcriptional regulator [Paenibacillus sp.]
MYDSQIKQAVSIFPCFSSISQQDWQSAAIATADPSTQHSIIEGHMLQHALFILQGRVRIYKTNAMGREVTLYRIQGGECCPLMLCSILGGMEYEASAEVEVSTELLIVPIDLFNHWLDRYTPLKSFVFKQITQKVIQVTRLLDDIAFKSIHHRLAEFLNEQTSGGLNQIIITHEQLAVELGTAREVVSRALKDFEKRGLLRLGRGRMELIDQSLLKQMINNVTKSR